MTENAIGNQVRFYLRVAVEAGEKVIDAKEGEDDREKTDHREPGGARAAPFGHEVHVKINGVNEPGNQGPPFLRVVRPVRTPGFGGPERAHDDPEGQQREAERNPAVGPFFERVVVGKKAFHFEKPEQPVNRQRNYCPGANGVKQQQEKRTERFGVGF